MRAIWTGGERAQEGIQGVGDPVAGADRSVRHTPVIRHITGSTVTLVYTGGNTAGLVGHDDRIPFIYLVLTVSAKRS